MLGKRKQEEVKDGLRDADKRVLRRVDAFAGVDLEQEIGEEDKAEEERDVVQGPTDGAVRIREVDAENGFGLYGWAFVRGGKDAVDVGALGGEAGDQEA